MLITNLEKIFEITNNGTQRAVLIDGKWGCGKTTSIMDFLNSHNDLSIVYISLFGSESAEDIVLKLSEYLDSSFISIVDGHYFLKSNYSLNNTGNRTLVFLDDLERKGSSLKYPSIYGVVDHLKRLGFSVICVCSSNEIKKEEEKNDYNTFLEKTFDDILFVEADPSLAKTIVDDNFELDVELLNDVDQNWRILKRAYGVVQKLENVFKEKSDDDFYTKTGSSKEYLIKSASYALKCFYSSNREKPQFQNNTAFARFAYEYDVEQFGECVANELYNLTAKNKKGEFKGTIRSILKCLSTSDYSSFIEERAPTFNDPLFEKYPFDRPIFYLDENGRKEYKNAFLENLDLFDFSNPNHRFLLSNVLKAFFDEFTMLQRQKIMNRLVDTVKEDQEKELFDGVLIDGIEQTKKMVNFRNSISKAMSDKKVNKDANTIDTLAKNRDYDKLLEYLKRMGSASSVRRDSIARVLQENGYVYPDLSKAITPSSWQYSKAATKFVSDTSLRKTLLESLRKSYHSSTSALLRNRIKSLAKSELDDSAYRVIARPIVQTKKKGSKTSKVKKVG